MPVGSSAEGRTDALDPVSRLTAKDSDHHDQVIVWDRPGDTRVADNPGAGATRMAGKPVRNALITRASGEQDAAHGGR